MDLGKFVLDRQLLDSDNRRCGKVDDLLIVVEGDGLPIVAGIIAQQGALAQDSGAAVLYVVRWIYRLLGVQQPRPIIVDWDLVEKVDVVVHLSKTRHELGLDQLQSSLSSRIVSKIPGS
jgi:sporulation protein YlmC with PRC-barrel domain